MTTIIRHRRGTSSQWASSTYILKVAELGFDTTLKRFKVGDGVSLWSGLNFLDTPLDTEAVQDIIGGMVDGNTETNIVVEYNDTTGKLNFSTGPDVVTTTSLSNTLTNPSSGYVAIADIGVADGVASLGPDGKIPDSEIPLGIARDSEIPSLVGYATETHVSTSISTHNSSTTSVHGISNTADLATKNYVDTAVSSLVDSAPTTLNTLNELSIALGNDANYATTISTALGSKLDSTTASSTYLTQSNAASTYAPISNPTFTGTVNGITKSMVGLGSVNNTSDADKPISTATQAALDTKLNSTTASSTYSTITDLSLKLNSSDFTYQTITIPVYTAITDLPSASSNHGRWAHVHGEGAMYFAHGGSWYKAIDSSSFTYESITIPVYTAVADLPAASSNHGRWAHVHGEGAMYFAHGGSWYKALDQSNLYVVKNLQSTTYSLDPSDLNKMIEMSGGGFVDVTDSASFANGFSVDILQTGSSQVTIRAQGSTVINATPGLKLRTQWSSGTLIKRDTNLWVLIGDLSA